jgi:hypothetical protein
VRGRAVGAINGEGKRVRRKGKDGMTAEAVKKVDA